ncbi:unnamed protein product [Parnassius apollo]|uniref:(apollo) hypothetical protein n=1 Tax=Parnassius apollo TaxID=110799 RepID=A0A8S3YAF0_PARAO|nr:unnamed protein product [Parnassius apollo]
MIPRVEDTQQNFKEPKESNLNYEYEYLKNVKWYHQLLLNRPLKVLFAIFLTAVVAPLLIYHYWYFQSIDSPPSDGYSTGSCLIRRASRLACGIGTMNESDCHPQCCYDVDNKFCFHRLPSRFCYILDQEWTENVTLQPRVSTVPYLFQRSTVALKLSIDELTPTHLSLNFYNPQLTIHTGKRVEVKDYAYEITSPEMNVVVNSSHGNIFNTMKGPLIASQNIWEIVFKITDEYMFGLGEIPLKQGTVKIIYNYDRGVSSVPLIFAKSNNSYHGLLIEASTPTEVSILGEYQIVVRSITSFGLKFHLFTGPRPKDVMKDVMHYIGSYKHLDYWMLGAHICSEISETTEEAFAELNDFINKASTQNLPYESHCGTMPIVFKSDRCDATEEDFINKGVQLLKTAKKRFVPHISPYIRHHELVEAEEETEMNEEIKSNCTSNLLSYEKYIFRDSNTLKMYMGLVGPHSVLYLNYESISEELIKQLWPYNTDVDGLVLENNWPLDETLKLHNETSLYLPYFNENFEHALDRTPQWNLTLPDGGKYLYKNSLYGNTFINAAQKMFNKEIPKWSSSQWMNGEVVINRQNIDTSWTHLHKELITMALGGVSGHWLWSSPVCGDTENFEIDRHSQLCVKWYMAATFFPILKIHSKTVPRDPIQFVGTYRTYIGNALNHRLSLLPYIYTTLQEGPLLRPMFYQYPTTAEIQDLNTQFNVGEDLLITPNLQPSQTHVHIWMPPGTWYELWSGLKLNGSVGEAVTMITTDADFLTIIRGGSILIIQKEVKETAEETRLLSRFSLIIALECMNTTEYLTDCEAAGHLFMSSNMTIDFRATTEQLYITTKGEGYETFCDSNIAVWANIIKEVIIYGLDEKLNNYDNHKQIQTSIDLCQLRDNNEILFEFA